MTLLHRQAPLGGSTRVHCAHTIEESNNNGAHKIKIGELTYLDDSMTPRVPPYLKAIASGNGGDDGRDGSNISIDAVSVGANAAASSNALKSQSASA